MCLGWVRKKEKKLALWHVNTKERGRLKVGVRVMDRRLSAYCAEPQGKARNKVHWTFKEFNTLFRGLQSSPSSDIARNFVFLLEF